MTNDAFQNTLANDQRLIENALQQLLPPTVFDQGEVVEAMRYSLMNGGKRLRPVLALEFCKVCGGDRHAVLEPACALEYVHTYSLTHDDLPCMDDDDLRRGRPSCHKAYPENIALLAGDALLTHAFEIIADCELSADAKCQMVSLLAANAGVSGMIGGQVLDLKYEAADPSLQQLLTVHKLKTGALISAACILGCLAAGATQAQIAAASNFAYNLGIAFQIKDDILDITGTSEMLGKPVGSDSDQGKVTYATKVGLEKAQQDVALLTDKALESLRAFDDTDFLQALAQSLISRDH